MNRKVENLQDLERIKQKGLNSIYPDKTKVAVGTATCGLASGAGEVLETITREVRKKNLPMPTGMGVLKIPIAVPRIREISLI